jgi:citrate lyase subunit beta/citryl-CoA lyase
MTSPRSFLYVPGDAPDKLAGAARRGADVVIADLEDAVPLASKTTARRLVCDWLHDLRDVPRWVRINADAEHWRADLDAILAAGADGIVVPKADTERLQEVVATRDRAGADRVAVAGLVETARAVRQLDAIAAVPGLRHLAFGEADLCAELGIERSPGDLELAPLRVALVAASAAAGLAPPVASTSTDFRDLDALRRSTEQHRRMGFRGRTAIHPAQVAVINDVFTPTPDAVAAARDTVGRYEAALAEGRAVATDACGRMIDEAVVRSARLVLAYAR